MPFHRFALSAEPMRARGFILYIARERNGSCRACCQDEDGVIILAMNQGGPVALIRLRSYPYGFVLYESL